MSLEWDEQMILALFVTLLLLGLALVVLGLSKPSETAQAMVGFSFLFLLGIALLNSGIDYQSGAIIQTNYTYSDNQVISTNQTITYVYSTEFEDDTYWGMWLAIGSAIGFVGTLFSYTKGKMGDRE